jgi:prefoldin subunit 5
MSRVRERMAICERELQRLAAERQEQESLIASRQAELAAIEQTRAQFETQLQPDKTASPLCAASATRR